MALKIGALMQQEAVVAGGLESEIKGRGRGGAVERKM